MPRAKEGQLMNPEEKTTWNLYDLAEPELKAFTRSAVRMKVLLNLLEGEKNVGKLEKELGIRASTILHSIKEMIEEDIMAKAGQGYALTNIGRIQALILDDLVSTIVTLDQHQDFWLTHDISGIPTPLLKEVGMLSRSEIMKGDSASILKTQEYFISELEKSKEIKGVSPIVVPGYAEAIAQAVMSGAKVDLILTDTVMEIALKQNRELGQKLMKYENFRLYRIGKDITIAFTVTDSLLSLGLFRINGFYDVGADLNCFGDKAIEWGKKLFAHYQSISDRVEGV